MGKPAEGLGGLHPPNIIAELPEGFFIRGGWQIGLSEYIYIYFLGGQS